MPNATVTITYVNEPAQGRKYGSISTKELGYLSVKPEELPLFQKGGRYDIEWAPKVINGKEYKNFVRINAPPPGTQAAPGEHARMIFITGVVGRAMGSGSFGGPDICMLTLEAAEAWKRLMALGEEPDEPEDEIPF